jgi:hypothetical protein
LQHVLCEFTKYCVCTHSISGEHMQPHRPATRASIGTNITIPKLHIPIIILHRELQKQHPTSTWGPLHIKSPI